MKVRSFRYAFGVRASAIPFLLVLAAASPASALTILRLEPASSLVLVGRTVEVGLVADFTEPVVAFGLDLEITPVLLIADAPPLLGPAWLAVAAPDGDGLAGLTATSGIVGTDILIAKVRLMGLVPGTATLVGSSSPGDLTEGFGLSAPGSFDEVQFESTAITVVIPEPSTIALIAMALPILGRVRRP